MSITPLGSHSSCSSESAYSSASTSSSAWEAICPELFALILKAVQENAREDPSEARRVVALAGVCRRWRHLVQQSYSSPRGLLQFPFSLIRSSAGHVRCLLKRAGPGGLFVLFQENSPGPKLDFLMAACRKQPWRPSASFAISASHRCFSKHGHAYMGKLTSDLWGQEFCLWEACGNDPSAKRPAARIRFWDQRADQGSPFMQRRMACEVFNITARKKGSRRVSQAVIPHERQGSSHGAGHGWQKWACFLDPSSSSSSSATVRPAAAAKKTFLRSYSSLRRSSGQLPERSRSCRRSRELTPNPNSFLMESKAPEWDEQRGCWSLDFHGRASLPSHHSFQLVRKRPPPNQPSSVDANYPLNDHNGSSALAQDAEEQETVFLQLGKVGKGLYTLDFCHPLSAFQAFSISLSSFATKVGVEP